MTIKRKTQLNLSGSHHNVDADIAWVGSNLYVTGSSQFTGSAYFQHITGSISGTLGGQPYLVAGPNMAGVNYNAGTGQWELSGATGTSVAGSNTYVQFNGDGTHAASSLLTFITNSIGNIGANTLAFPSGNVGVLSGSNIDNQAYTLVLSAAAAQPIPGGPFPGFFDPAVVVLTPVVMSQSLMLFDGRHDPLGFGDSDFPGGGLVLANDAQFALYSGSWNPLPSDFGGKDPVVSIYNDNNGGAISVVGQLNVLSSSTDKQNVFSVRASNTAGQVELKNVGTAEFLSGNVSLAYGSELNVYSGSNNGPAQFTVGPSFTSGKVAASLKGAMTITSGSLNVNSGSGDDGSFLIEPSATAGQVNVIFDRTGSTEGFSFQGINVRPLYSFYNDIAGTSFIMAGDLLSVGNAGNNSIGKIDFNIIAVSKDSDNYASWTFSTTVARNIAGTTVLVGIPTELDSATSGTAAATWDVNINGNATIACTGSALAATNPIKWYAQITKKMFVSGSGLITY